MRAPGGWQRRPRDSGARAGACSAARSLPLPRSRVAPRPATGGGVRQRAFAGAPRWPRSPAVPRGFVRSHAFARSWRRLSEPRRWRRVTTHAFASRRRSWPADAAGTAPRARRRAPGVCARLRAELALRRRPHAGGGAENHVRSSGARPQSQREAAGRAVRAPLGARRRLLPGASWRGSRLALPARSAAAKLDNAITSQNESYLNNQTEQQALLLRHERCAPRFLARRAPDKLEPQAAR